MKPSTRQTLTLCQMLAAPPTLLPPWLRYTWHIYSERLMTLAGVYGFWKYVSNLDRRETRRYLEMFYVLKLPKLVLEGVIKYRWNKAALLMGLEYLIGIAYVDDTEVFKVCLDWWNALVSELFEASHNLDNPAAAANMMGLQGLVVLLLGVGAFSENGPFRPSGEILVRNEYSWNKGPRESSSTSGRSS